MPIHLNCPVCNQRLRVPNFAAGRITKCTGCGNAVRVPQPKEMLKDETQGTSEDPSTETTEQQEEAFSLSEAWYRSIERLSGSLDWLAERPTRIAGAAAILVACFMGVATAKWALSKPAEGPIVSVEPEDPDPWDGVGLSDANDHFRVTVQSAAMGQIEVIPPNMRVPRKTPNAYFKITLKIDNLTPSDLKYTGWSLGSGRDEHAARIRDDSGGIDKQLITTARIVGQTTSAVIPPSGSASDMLVFDPPPTYAKYLKLTLPATACGGTGNLRIKIPHTRVID
jgi:hypothetical protein